MEYKTEITGAAKKTIDGVLFQFMSGAGERTMYQLISPVGEAYTAFVGEIISVGDVYTCGCMCTIPSERREGQLLNLRGVNSKGDKFEFTMRVRAVICPMKDCACFPYFCSDALCFEK